MSASRFALILLLAVTPILMGEDVNLPRIAVIPVLQDAGENYSEEQLLEAAETVFTESGRFVVVDVSTHEDYRGDPAEQTIRLRSIAADFSVDLFMLLDVSIPETSVSHGTSDSMFVTRDTQLFVTGRFYTSEGTLIGSIRENMHSGGFSGSSSIDIKSLAEEGIREVAMRSLVEIFAYEFTFTAGSGPVFSIPVGTSGGVQKGMVFSVVARSEGIPRSAQEYSALGSHGIIQIMDADSRESSGRLVAGRIIEGANLTAVENSSPALLSLSYALLPSEVVPGDGLTGEEAETEKTINQAEFTGATGKWGLSLGGSLYSGVMPRMSSIGIRGEMGTRLPLSSPSLALRIGVGFEAAFLTQNTRADSISSSASTATIAGTGTVNLEWMFSSRFGIHTGLTGRVGTTADSWSVTSWNGYNRDAYPGELYYAEIKQSPICVSAGLTYMIY